MIFLEQEQKSRQSIPSKYVTSTDIFEKLPNASYLIITTKSHLNERTNLRYGLLFYDETQLQYRKINSMISGIAKINT